MFRIRCWGTTRRELRAIVGESPTVVVPSPGNPVQFFVKLLVASLASQQPANENAHT